jgi:hypothetical protein
VAALKKKTFSSPSAFTSVIPYHPLMAERMLSRVHWEQEPQPHEPSQGGLGKGPAVALGPPRKKEVGEEVPVAVWLGEEEGVGVPVGVGEGVVDALQPKANPNPKAPQGAGVGESEEVHQGQGAPVGDGTPPTRHAAARLFEPVKAALGKHVAGVRMMLREVPPGPHVEEPANVVKFAPVAPKAFTPRERTGVSR